MMIKHQINLSFSTLCREEYYSCLHHNMSIMDDVYLSNLPSIDKATPVSKLQNPQAILIFEL